MKNIIFILCFNILAPIFCASLIAQENQQYIIDSLSTKATNEIGQSKLETLSKLVEVEAFSPNLLSRLDELEKEAKKQKNDRFILFSYNYRITYHIRNNNSDSIRKYIRLSAPIVKELDPTDNLATHNEFLKVIDYTSRGLFDLALLTQKKYFEKIESLGNVKPVILAGIYIGLGNTYFYKANYTEALRYFEYAKDLQPTDTKLPSYISTLYLIALCHTNLANYTEALQYCTLANTVMNDNKEAITDESRTYFNLVASTITIQAYSGSKDFTMAKAVFEQLPADIDSTSFREQKDDYYLALSVYYASIKEYRSALKSVDLGLEHLKSTNKIITQPDFIKEKASLLYNMQNYKEAYTELLKATKLADSIRSSHSAIQLDELAIAFEVDLKNSEITEANAQLKYTQTIIAALIVISILLLLLILVFVLNSRKQKAKNILLFKQQVELNKSIDYYKNIIAEDLQYNSTNTNPLFLKLEEYILKEKAYKRPDISRDEIASILHTNRQYLSSAIKDATGLTFTNYINKYRLEDAKKLLLEHDEIMIDDIIIKSGFSSRPTFHRLFKDRYGMAPNELKRAAIALQNEIKDDEK